MEQVPYSEIDKGSLLIAMPEIDIGLFFRSVILVCEHNPNGSFGIVINKSFHVDLPEEVVNLSHVANPHVQMRAGGPVQTNQMMLLHTNPSLVEQTLKICDEVYLGGDLQFLQESINNEKGPFIHICFGYAGWGAGQLEREFIDGQWLLYPADKELIFDVPAERLWQDLLRRIGGKYATLSMIPEDLSLN